jgi:arabinan endo-1,5-alpha-L-arabinosidase
MMKEGDYYYVFYTGGLLNSIRSKDLKTWERVLQKDGDRDVSTVFTQANAPTWSVEIQGQGGRGRGRGGQAGAATQPGTTPPSDQLPSAQGQAPTPPTPSAPPTPAARSGIPGQGPGGTFVRRDYWAPDISFHNGQYFLYYCASSFGSNRSGIGLATSRSLDPASPNFKWQDQGKIIESHNPDFYNCIDPNAFFDKDGSAYLTFGSFYWNVGGGRGGAPANPDAATKGGIMLVKIDPATGKVLPGSMPKTIASRAYPERAIEAPFLVRVGNWYYLFVSWDVCCRGVQSTYRIMVGRSDKATGPFLDKEGKDMALGGGTQVLAGDGDRIIGPGHQGLMEEGTPGTPNHRWLLLYHFYDGHQNGVSKLQVRPVTFDTGWPVLGEVINKPTSAPPRPTQP